MVNDTSIKYYVHRRNSWSETQCFLNLYLRFQWLLWNQTNLQLFSIRKWKLVNGKPSFPRAKSTIAQLINDLIDKNFHGIQRFDYVVSSCIKTRFRKTFLNKLYTLPSVFLIETFLKINYFEGSYLIGNNEKLKHAGSWLKANMWIPTSYKYFTSSVTARIGIMSFFSSVSFNNERDG